MATVRCSKCEKEFGSERALKIHLGLKHPSKSKARRPRKRRSLKKPARASRRGKFVCPDCGRSFKLAMHLARHQTASHGARRRTRKAGRRTVARGAKPRATSRISVAALPVGQLLALKKDIDARLTHIAREMRKARVKL